MSRRAKACSRRSSSRRKTSAGEGELLECGETLGATVGATMGRRAASVGWPAASVGRRAASVCWRAASAGLGRLDHSSPPPSAIAPTTRAMIPSRNERRTDAADDARSRNRRKRPGGGGKVGRADALTRWVSAPSCPGVAGAGPGRSNAGRSGSGTALRPNRRRAIARCAPGGRGLADTRPAVARPVPGVVMARRPALSSTGMGTALCRRSSANSAAVHRRCGSATNACSSTATTGGGSTASRSRR